MISSNLVFPGIGWEIGFQFFQTKILVDRFLCPGSEALKVLSKRLYFADQTGIIKTNKSDKSDKDKILIL